MEMSSSMSIILLCCLFLLVVFYCSDDLKEDQKKDVYLFMNLGVIQMSTIIYIIYFDLSNSLMIIVEAVNALLFFLLFSSVLDSGFLFMLILPMLLIIFSILIQEVCLMSSILYCKMFVLGIVLKYGLLGTIVVFEFPSKIYGEYSTDSLNLFLYMVSSKFLFIMYGWYVESDTFNLGVATSSFFQVDKVFYPLILFMVIGMLIGAMYLLSMKDMEGYLLNSFCMGHLLLLVTSFIDTRIFCLCFMWEMFLNIVYYLMFYVSKVNPLLLSNEGIKGIMMFLCICQNVGVPPFPSFHLEANFLSMIYAGVSGSIGLALILMLYSVQVGQLIMFCYFSFSTSYYNDFKVKSESLIYTIVYLVFYIMLWGCLFWFGV